MVNLTVEEMIRTMEGPEPLTIPEGSHLFLTGAAGFVGSNVLRYVLDTTDWTVTCPVTMRHKGDQGRLGSVLDTDEKRARVNIIHADLSMPFHASSLGITEPVDYIWNIASESHVDRSLEEPVPFVRNNVDLILNVLEFAREVKPKLVLQMSTDEVFGPTDDATDHLHTEWASIKPSNPYAASKAAQEAIAFSYWRAFNVPLVITNTMNLIGPAQHPEKFVPKTIRHVLNDWPVIVHSSPEGESGSRCWIGVEEFASAWLFLTLRFLEDPTSLTYYPTMPGEPPRYNIVGEFATNLRVAELIGESLSREPQIELVDFHTSRPGHDMHYGLDGTKMEEIGWVPELSLAETLDDLVRWYVSNPEFLEM